MGANRIFRVQAELQCNRAARSKRIEVKNRLRCGLSKLLKAPSLLSGALFDVCLQVLAKKIESRWNSEIDHDHVRRFIEIVLDGCCCHRNIVLGKVGTI